MIACYLTQNLLFGKLSDMKKSVLLLFLLIISMTDIAYAEENTKTLEASLNPLSSDYELVTAKISMIKYSADLIHDFTEVWGVDESKPNWVCKEMVINKGNKRILVPLTGYCDLADISKISLEKSGESFVLIILGGETASHYTCKVYFDNHVTRREVRLQSFPDEVWDLTVYHVNELNK